MITTDFELDIDVLLSELSAELPCGEDLEYDAVFGEMERAAEPKPEQQFGNTIIPGEGPEWKLVLKHARALFERTRDLRVAVYFAQSTLAVHGLPIFARSVSLLRGLIERYWEHVHPRLDPDDDNDPTIRVNAIASLSDSDTTLALLKATPIVTSRSVGRFSYRDVLIAQGELSAPEGAEAPDMGVISAAFADVAIDELQADQSMLEQLLEDVRQIETQVTEQVGVGRATSLEPLREVIRAIQVVYRDQLVKRGVSQGANTADADGTGADGAVAEGAEPRLSGQITNREDVVRALEKLTEYYERHEPSSPLPLLLNRAKRLAHADFLSIIRDIAPEGFDQARAIGGTAANGDDN